MESDLGYEPYSWRYQANSKVRNISGTPKNMLIKAEMVCKKCDLGGFESNSEGRMQTEGGGS
jgi:hypothetical protein